MLAYIGLWTIIVTCIAAVMLCGAIYATFGLFAILGSCDADEYELEETRTEIETTGRQLGAGAILAIATACIAFVTGCIMFGTNMIIPIGVAIGIYCIALLSVTIIDRISARSTP